MTTTVELHGTGGVTLRADLYEPVAPGSGWSLVLCPGYASTAALMAGWGERLAAAGHLVGVPHYRGYGDGSPVGRIFPDEHVDDARALAHLLAGAPADGPRRRVAVVGVSYGGAVAVEAAAVDSTVDAAVSIVGYGSGARHLAALRRHHEWLDLLDRVAADRFRRARTGVSDAIEIDDVLVREEEGRRWRRQVEQLHPEMRFAITLESVDRLLTFAPDRLLPFRRHVPLLVIAAERDRMIPAKETERVHRRARHPKRLVTLPGAEHHDVHQGTAFERCLEEIEDFLTNAATTRGAGPPGASPPDHTPRAEQGAASP
ncbi:MAG TPA: alpha/beta hydrolase [Acidimicrobiia bacterium]